MQIFSQGMHLSQQQWLFSFELDSHFHFYQIYITEKHHSYDLQVNH